MTADIVQAQYDELNEVAARFGHQAEVSSELYSRLEQAFQSLAYGGWEGRGSQAFIAEMSSEVFPAVQRLTQALEEARAVTLQTKEIFQRAEEEAAAAFGGDGAVGGGTGSGDAVPAGGAPTAAEPADLGSQIMAGIESLFGAGRRGLDALVGVSDGAVAWAFNQLLPHTLPGSKETMTIELKGGVTIPGIEIGLPGSIKLAGADSMAISHNPDGTYTLTIKRGGAAGLHENLYDADAKLRIGRQTYGVDVGAEGQALGKGELEVAFKFDPNKPGDMTKMAGFVGSLGAGKLLPIPAPLTVGPALYTLSDNLESIKGGVGAEGKVQMAASLADSKLFGIGAEGEGALMRGGEIRRNDSGQREVVTSISGELGVKGNLAIQPLDLQLAGGRKGQLSAEAIYNIDTGATSTKVKLEISASGEGVVGLDDIKSYLPPNAATSSLGLSVKGEAYGKVIVEYTLDAPVESVREALFPPGGQPNFDPIIRNSTVEVKGAVGTTDALGIEGSLGIATQNVGLEAEGSYKRESEVPIFKYTPGR